MRTGGWRGLCVLVALLAPPARGAAAATPETIALRYEAPSGCPDRSTYVSRVEVHGGDVALIGADAATVRVFVVRIDERDGQFVGAVTIVAGRDQTSRSIAAADCRELVDALALVTVLAIDPSASVAAATPVASPRAARWRAAVGAGGAAAFGVAPSTLPSLPGFVELDDRLRGRLRLSGRWGRRSADVGTASATFAWTRLQLDACPRAIAFGAGRVTAGVCAGVQAGVLRAQGAEIDAPQGSTRPWIAPAAGARVRWQPGAHWFAELEAIAAFPLVRDRFFFAPDTTIHQVPPVVGEVAVLVGSSIP